MTGDHAGDVILAVWLKAKQALFLTKWPACTTCLGVMQVVLAGKVLVGEAPGSPALGSPPQGAGSPDGRLSAAGSERPDSMRSGNESQPARIPIRA